MAESSSVSNVKDQFFLVFYSKDETIHLWPAETKEECLSKLSTMLKNPKIKQKYKCSTIIKRNMNNYEDGLIFGKRDYVDKTVNK